MALALRPLTVDEFSAMTVLQFEQLLIDPEEIGLRFVVQAKDTFTQAQAKDVFSPGIEIGQVD